VATGQSDAVGPETAIPPEVPVMMTLSALAATSGPIQQTVQEQEQAILAAINGQLSNTGLATQGQWQAIWVGLSLDLANLAYIAQDTAASNPTYAVVIRGTVAGNTIDLAEDWDVTEVKGFWGYVGLQAPPLGCADANNANAVCISQGAMQAFQEVTGAVGSTAEAYGTTLEQMLTTLVSDAGNDPTTIWVTGHSLGGATATTVALYLAKGVTWATVPTIVLYTFAAPTAGTTNFANLATETFGSYGYSVYNMYDAVPMAWQNLAAIDGWYPAGPVASQTTCVPTLVKDAEYKPGNSTYAQPGLNDLPLNSNFGAADTDFWESTDADFMGQALFQHNNNVYLYMLGAPFVTPAPGAPTSLAAVPGGVMLCGQAPPSFRMTLYWTAPAPDLGSAIGAPSGAPETYTVLRSTTSGSGYTAIGQTGAGVTTYVDTQLPAQTTYYYVVQAPNSAGVSPPSAEVSATTGQPTL
jgi:hypothetical protein